MSAIDNKILELESAVDLERVHNDHLHALNIDLKNRIRALELKLKVVVLPVTVQMLVKEINEQDDDFGRLADAFVQAIGMIPKTDENRLKIDYLRQIYQDVC